MDWGPYLSGHQVMVVDMKTAVTVMDIQTVFIRCQ